MASFLELLMASPEVKPLLSSEHFSVDGTLLRAWASHGSLVRIDGSDDDPPPPSGGNGFGTGASKGKKRAKGDFRGLLPSNQTHRSSSDGEARLLRSSNSTRAYLSNLGHCLMGNRHGLVLASEMSPADGYGERAAAVRMARSLRLAHQMTLGADKGYGKSIHPRKRIEEVFRLHVVAYNLVQLANLLSPREALVLATGGRSVGRRNPRATRMSWMPAVTAPLLLLTGKTMGFASKKPAREPGVVPLGARRITGNTARPRSACTLRASAPWPPTPIRAHRGSPAPPSLRLARSPP